MRQAIRDWLAETHGTRFELLRHFLPRFFDSELVTSSSDWMRVAVATVAVLASSWILLFATLLFKYKKLAEMNLMSRFPQEVAADLASLTCIVVCLTILLVAALWQSVYPTFRDCLALAARPVSLADIFVAKFSAVAVAFSVAVLLLSLPTAIVYARLWLGDLGCALGRFNLFRSRCLHFEISSRGDHRGHDMNHSGGCGKQGNCDQLVRNRVNRIQMSSDVLR